MSTLKTTNLKHPSSGSDNIVLAADGSTTIATLSATDITGTTIQGTIKSGTAVASTSGTSVDFTGIPSWVKKITVMLDGVSTNGTSPLLIQLGDSGGIEITGYTSTSAGTNGSGGGTVSSTAGMVIRAAAATGAHIGHALLTLVGSNVWVESHSTSTETSGVCNVGAGSKTLSDTLTQLRITTVNGTDTFDAGSINILYEG